jgi:hypothetical protein
MKVVKAKLNNLDRKLAITIAKILFFKNIKTLLKGRHLKKVKINNKLRKIKKINNTNRIQFSTITLIIRNKFRFKLSEKTK